MRPIAGATTCCPPLDQEIDLLSNTYKAANAMSPGFARRAPVACCFGEP